MFGLFVWLFGVFLVNEAKKKIDVLAIAIFSGHFRKDILF